MFTGSVQYVDTKFNSGSISTTMLYTSSYDYTYTQNVNGINRFHEIDERPWGKYEVILDHKNCKVKLITITPGEAPSYQYHKKRSELWQIISGYGIVTLDGEDREVFPGSVVRVLCGEKHRIAAFGNEPLVFVEIQTGESFEETDIVRVADKYGRIKKKKDDETGSL